MSRRFWSPEEISFLEEASKTMPQAEVAEKLNRSVSSVRSYCTKNNIKFQIKQYSDGSVRRVWSKSEIALLYMYAERYSMPKAAKKLKRSLYSVKCKVADLGISFKNSRLSLDDLSEILGVHKRTVAIRRDKLGLSFRKNARTKGSMGGPTAQDIVTLARDFLEDPPLKDLRVNANHFRKVIEEYQNWEG